jgi:hypothetical protein
MQMQVQMLQLLYEINPVICLCDLVEETKGLIQEITNTALAPVKVIKNGSDVSQPGTVSQCFLLFITDQVGHQVQILVQSSQQLQYNGFHALFLPPFKLAERNGTGERTGNGGKSKRADFRS